MPAGGMVVCGVDGSRSACDAVRWAALEAERRDVGLRLVQASRWHVPDAPRDAPHRRSAQVDEAVEVAEKTVSGLAVSADVVTGHAVPVLVGAARDAGLLVLGHGGLGGVAGMLAGSVVIALAARAACPVVVVRGKPSPSSGPVVVGVDGSAAGDQALRFGFVAAAARAARLVAVHTWRDPLLSPPAVLLLDRSAIGSAARHRLADRVAACGHDFPGVAVDQVVRWDAPAAALIERSAGAQLVAVGSRWRGGFTVLLRGSVSRALLRHAQCPVAVVPAEIR